MIGIAQRRRVAHRLAPIMFTASVVFLIGLAALVVLLVDVPNMRERAMDRVAESRGADVSAALGNEEPTASPLDGLYGPTRWIGFAMLLLWPAFIFDALASWLTRPWTGAFRRAHAMALISAACPPLRMCARSPEFDDRVWLPRWGWQKPNDDLRLRITRRYSGPMLAVAMLILPVLGVEFFLSEQVENNAWLRMVLHFCTGLIWFAFTTEFIVMVSIAERKLQYCKTHWIDLAIILLPLLSFLRSLQVVRATRLARVTRVQQLTKFFRVYRLRGVSTKVVRALVLLEVVHRLIGNSPEKRLKRLHRRRDDLIREVSAVDREIALINAKSPGLGDTEADVGG